MYLMDKLFSVDPHKSIVADTSHILSNDKPFDYPNQIFITQGVIDELFKLSHDSDSQKSTVAKQWFDEVRNRIKKGDLFFIKSKTNSPTGELSAIDENVIHVAQWLPNSCIFSNDHALCQRAHELGIQTYSIRTNGVA